MNMLPKVVTLSIFQLPILRSNEKALVNMLLMLVAALVFQAAILALKLIAVLNARRLVISFDYDLRNG